MNMNEELMNDELENDEGEVIEYHPPAEPIVRKSFTSFAENFIDQEGLTEEDLRFLYLKAYLQFPTEAVAKSLKVKKQKAIDLCKKYEKEISNIIFENRVETRIKNKATQADFENVAAKTLGRAIRSLGKRVNNENCEFEELTIEKHIKIVSELNKALALKNEVFTGKSKLIEEEFFEAESYEEEV
ncbi:MAG: hypothetical protein WC635_12505 [Bacteriovorax sp.]|jgi:hypothetical protein